MTRTLKQRESDGKPLPSALMDADALPEFIDEPTVRMPVPSKEDLEQHLRSRAEAGQGDDYFSYRRPL